MKKFTDIHHHLLYGLDDGAVDRKMMGEMLRRAAADGVGQIIATPHVTPGVHRFNVEQYLKSLEDAAAICEEENLGVEVYAGAEILYTDLTCRLLQEELIPTLAGTDRVLVEFSPDIPYKKLCLAVDRLLSAGYLPVIAHVERYDCLNRHPDKAIRLKEQMDVFFQVNCHTVLHGGNRAIRKFVRLMMEDELIDAVASDAHNTTSRVTRLREAYDVLSDEYGTIYAKRLLNGSLLTDR